jgi:hypothetical protein
MTNPTERRDKIKREFEVRDNLIEEVCPVCKSNFKLGEKIILCPIQEPKGDYWINAIALPIHTKCHYIDKE